MRREQQCETGPMVVDSEGPSLCETLGLIGSNRKMLASAGLSWWGIMRPAQAISE